MAEKLDPRQLVTFEELLTNEEVLEEIKAVRCEIVAQPRHLSLSHS